VAMQLSPAGELYRAELTREDHRDLQAQPPLP
jgi:hypothetical protein